MKTIQTSLLLFLLVSLVSCSQFVLDSLGIESGELLFHDGFSDLNSGWDRVQQQEYIADYAGGTYRIYINQPNLDVWSNPGLEFSDVIIEVDATKAGGSDDNNFGVICRSDRDADRFYYFVISSDGYYAIGKVIDQEQILIGDDVMQPSQVIRQGYAHNHIRAECIGDKLSLLVNDQPVAAVSDGEFLSGDVGMLAGTFDSPGVDIYFDNFQVIQP